MSNTPAPLCFTDTETTGTQPGRRVWEIGMIRRDFDADGRAHEAETSFFVSVDLAFADPFGLNVGRFYERHPYGRHLAGETDHPPVSGYCDERTAARRVARFTHGAHIVGAVPNFDTETLAKMLRGQNIVPAWHYHLIDVENLAVGWLAAQIAATRLSGAVPERWASGVTPPWSSDQLTEALGIPPVPAEERHTALGDVRWAKAIYDRVMGGAA